jgi:tol-pal system protein YbgF
MWRHEVRLTKAGYFKSEDNGTLKKHATSTLIVFAALFMLWGVPPAYGVSREILQMMQQLDSLQQAVSNIQKTVDTQSAVLKTLIEQSNSNVNSMKVTVDELRKNMEQNLANSGSRLDSLSSQIQALSESLEEAKSRLGKLSDQVAQTQNIIQTLNQPAAGSNPQTPGSPGGSPTAKPDADSLYKSGLTSFNGGQYQLAIQSFQDYMKYYGDTDLASNAQFYIGESFYAMGNYPQAIEAYNICIERYPGGNKQQAAQLKKAYGLLELNQTQAGIRELRSLVQRYPSSHEAELARQRLKKLGAAASATSRRRGV